MINIFRLFIDKYSDRHSDIFIKIDLMPSTLDIGDSYFLYDYLGISEEEYLKLNLKAEEVVPFAVNKLLEIWQYRILNLKKGESTFLVYGLFDEYVSAYKVEKVKHGFELEDLLTSEVNGWNYSFKNNDNDYNWKLGLYNKKRILSEEILLSGIQWSIDNLAK